jgi:predicted metal-dependent hydrolase
LENYWFNGSPTHTHFSNAWSALFPAWEQAFVTVAQHHKRNVSDEQLKARIDEFSEQELSHARAHTQHNKRVEVTILADKEFQKTRLILKRPGSPMWLATMVSIEHIAACGSRAFLTSFGDNKSREFNLYAWHSVEELKHKSLAMDLWKHLGFSKSELNKVAVKNAIYVWKFAFTYTIGKLKQDKKLWQLQTIVDCLGLLGYVTFKCWIPYLRIFKQDFHPDHIDDTKLIAAHK